MKENKTNTTHFGFEQVPTSEKAGKVADVFDSVAKKYDVMNDLMSLGIHRYWKHFTLSKANVRPGQRVLDIAGGTGDLAIKLASQVGKTGEVVLADINQAMLNEGRERMLDCGHTTNVHFVQTNAECLAFPNNYFDCITIAFGLRNVTDKDAALASMCRALKPGGKLLVLEFSKPIISLLEKIYDSYSFHVIPKIGKFVCDDEESYRYLVESIRMHPNQETLKSMMLNAGFDDCHYHNLSAGIVALHCGYKY